MKTKSVLDKGKLLGRSKNWKIYAPGPKLNKELDEARKKVKSGKVRYKKLDL
jgi:hypothetical protein